LRPKRPPASHEESPSALQAATPESSKRTPPNPPGGWFPHPPPPPGLGPTPPPPPPTPPLNKRSYTGVQPFETWVVVFGCCVVSDDRLHSSRCVAAPLIQGFKPTRFVSRPDRGLVSGPQCESRRCCPAADRLKGSRRAEALSRQSLLNSPPHPPPANDEPSRDARRGQYRGFRPCTLPPFCLVKGNKISRDPPRLCLRCS